MLVRKKEVFSGLADKNFSETNTLAYFAPKLVETKIEWFTPGNTKGESISVPLTSCLTGLESAVPQLTIFVFICKTD